MHWDLEAAPDGCQQQGCSFGAGLPQSIRMLASIAERLLAV
jgi:hypothetical protein